MYTIKEICSGAPMLVQSMLNRKREYRILFNKDKYGFWFVDFPHWPFSHDNLAMVSGADKMLALLADGDMSVKVSVIPAKKREQHEGYVELRQTEHTLLGGSTYETDWEPFITRYKRNTIWICPVTLFVLGRYPKFIYVTKIENQEDKEEKRKNVTAKETILEGVKEEPESTDENCYFMSCLKDRLAFLKISEEGTSVIEVREIEGERIVYDNRYSINWVGDYERDLKEISKEEYESVCKHLTDIEEYVNRKVENNDTFYISMTAEDGMEIFEFQGRTYKRSVGTVIDEGVLEGNFSDVNLDLVVSWAKRRGGACNILSKSDFDKWWKKRKR